MQVMYKRIDSRICRFYKYTGPFNLMVNITVKSIWETARAKLAEVESRFSLQDVKPRSSPNKSEIESGSRLKTIRCFSRPNNLLQLMILFSRREKKNLLSIFVDVRRKENKQNFKKSLEDQCPSTTTLGMSFLSTVSK